MVQSVLFIHTVFSMQILSLLLLLVLVDVLLLELYFIIICAMAFSNLCSLCASFRASFARRYNNLNQLKWKRKFL